MTITMSIITIKMTRSIITNGATTPIMMGRICDGEGVLALIFTCAAKLQCAIIINIELYRAHTMYHKSGNFHCFVVDGGYEN